MEVGYVHQEQQRKLFQGVISSPFKVFSNTLRIQGIILKTFVFSILPVMGKKGASYTE